MSRVKDKNVRKTPIDQSFISYQSVLYNFRDKLILCDSLESPPGFTLVTIGRIHRLLNQKSVNTPSPGRGVITVNPPLLRAGPSVIPEAASVR